LVHVKQEVTNVSTELTEPVCNDDIAMALADGFERSLQIRLERGDLTSAEIASAKELSEVKYVRDDWNLYGDRLLQWGLRDPETIPFTTSQETPAYGASQKRLPTRPFDAMN
jgi:hypothetical protein